MTTMLEELDELLFEAGRRSPAYRRLKKPIFHICSLEYSGRVRGTGVLVGPRTVLTAGSVVHDLEENLLNPLSMTVRAGIDSPLNDAKAVKLLPYPGYARRTRTDLAIVRLDKLLGRSFGYWTAPIGTTAFEDAQLPIVDDQPTLSLAGYPSPTRRSQYRLDNVGFTRSEGLINYARHKFKLRGHVGSPVWTPHTTRDVNILIGIHFGAATGKTASRAAAIEDDVVKFIDANKA